MELIMFFLVTCLSSLLLWWTTHEINRKLNINKNVKEDVRLRVWTWRNKNSDYIRNHNLSTFALGTLWVSIFVFSLFNIAYLIGALLPFAYLGIRPIVLILFKRLYAYRHPENKLDKDAKRIWDQADELVRTISASLAHTPITPENKAKLYAQARDVQRNILKSGQILKRLRETNELLCRQTQKYDIELGNIEVKRIKAMQDSLIVLRSIPVALLKLESASGLGKVDSIIKSLEETNQRMRDIAEVHEELSHTH